MALPPGLWGLQVPSDAPKWLRDVLEEVVRCLDGLDLRAEEAVEMAADAAEASSALGWADVQDAIDAVDRLAAEMEKLADEVDALRGELEEAKEE